MEFGRRLRELREAKGLSQDDLAKKADIRQSSIADWELGKTVPALNRAFTLCEALGVEIGVFKDCSFGRVTYKEDKRGRPRKKPPAK